MVNRRVAWRAVLAAGGLLAVLLCTIWVIPRLAPTRSGKAGWLGGRRLRGPLRETGDVVDLGYPLFFVDRVEDAIPASPQAPQVWRPVSERLRWPRLTASRLTLSHSAADPVRCRNAVCIRRG